MALPLGHGLLGATLAALLQTDQEQGRGLKVLATAATCAILPDFDYFFYRVLGWGESWHRSFSHSIVFALAVGALAAIVVGPRKSRSFVIYSLATFSHPILDAVISEHPSGVQLLWPLSDRAFGFGLGNYYNTVLGGYPTWSEVFWRVLAISSVELLVFGPILLAAIWLRRRARSYREGRSPPVNTTRS